MKTKFLCVVSAGRKSSSKFYVFPKREYGQSFRFYSKESTVHVIWSYCFTIALLHFVQTIKVFLRTGPFFVFFDFCY